MLYPANLLIEEKYCKKDTPDEHFQQEYHNTKTKLDLTKLFNKKFHNFCCYYVHGKYKPYI